ncbi:MAG: hypothetical protein ACFKPT_05280 [Gloeotrichia echinulata GP01]
MNESDTSNNGAFIESVNSANSPQPEQGTSPFDSVVPYKNVGITNLPLLVPAKDEPPQTAVPELSGSTTQQDWVAEPDSEKQALINSEFQKLLLLNEELQAANNHLYEQVEQLKGDLSESEKALQWQKKRSGVTESMLNQQTQEVAAAQEQIQSLFQQLETAVQTVQRQEISIDNYKAQLQISQQRLAQLERECALLQTNYSEQSQQLLQSETACRELRTRLMRQQRQTLQFKAALEKCLETPVPSDDNFNDTANSAQNVASKQTRFSKKARSLFPNAQPIKPWSVESDYLTDNLDQPHTPSSISDPYTSYHPVSDPSSPWDWSDQADTAAPAQSDPSSEIDDSPIIASEVSASGSSNINEQLNSLIQMFFASQSPSASPPATTDAQPIWDTLATTLGDNEQAETEPEVELAAEIHPAINTFSSSVQDYPVTVNESSDVSYTTVVTEATASVENEDYWSEISQLTEVELQPTDLTQDTDTKSPSPVVYPQRPPKGRKSLASVELPNFRHNTAT